MTHPRPRLRRFVAGVLAIGLASAALTACSATGADTGDGPGAESSSGDADKAAAPFRLRSSVTGDAVPVDRAVRLGVEGGSLTKVTVSSAQGALPGRLEDDGSAWTASARLDPGLAYRVRAVGEREDGKRVVRDQTFRTQALTLDQQTYASVAPLQGETVGVGMPVIVTFDVPVTDRASIEKHMSVSSSPRQPGS